jgi:hypothetical protein
LFSYRKLNDDFVRRNIILTSVSFIFNIENFILLAGIFCFVVYIENCICHSYKKLFNISFPSITMGSSIHILTYIDIYNTVLNRCVLSIECNAGFLVFDIQLLIVILLFLQFYKV